MRRFSHGVSRVVAAVGLITLSACGGDSTGPKGGQLTQAEAQTVAAALYSEISAALASATVVSDVAPSNAALSVAPTTLNMTVHGNCSAGGTVTGTYSLTTNIDQSGSGTSSGTATVTISQCAVSTGSRTIAINGQFNYGYSVSYASGQQSGNFVWTAAGNYAWEGGNCSVNYNITLTPAGHASYSGNICGTTFSVTSG